MRRNAASLGALASWLVTAIVLFPLPIQAEVPALARAFATERYVSGAQEIASILAQRRIVLTASGGAYQAGDETGRANPFGSWEQIGGGRIDLQAAVSRFTAGAEVIGDTPREVEGHEFRSRAYATAYVPEAHLSGTAAIGFDDDGFAGSSASLEMLLLRWKATRGSVDLRPRVWLWARAINPDGEVPVTLTPVIGMFVQHLPIFGSQAYVGASVASDLTSERLAVSQGLVQLGWGSLTKVIGVTGDPDSPTTSAGSGIPWDWFLAFGYGAPLDDRSVARFVSQVGLRVVKPLGS